MIAAASILLTVTVLLYVLVVPEKDAPPEVAPAEVCPHCGAKFSRPMKFCGECGAPMTGGSA